MVFVQQYCRFGRNKISKPKGPDHDSDGSVKGPKDRGQGSRIGGSHASRDHDSTRDLTGSHCLYVSFEQQIGIPTSAALRQSSVGIRLCFIHESDVRPYSAPSESKTWQLPTRRCVSKNQRMEGTVRSYLRRERGCQWLSSWINK